MLGVGILLTVGTGFFVASEFSMVNLERNELEARQSRGERGLSNTIRALKQTSTHLSGAQLGITLTTMLTGFLAEPSLTHLLSPTLTSWGVGESSVEPIALGVSMLLATVFSTLVGELIPKKLALTLPLEVNKFVVVFQLIFTWIFGWMIWALNRTGDRVVRMFGIEPKEELSSSRTAEELASLVRRSAEEGALDKQTATLITKTLSLSQLVAADVMTARPKVHVIGKDDSAADLVQLCNQTGHSRFPVVDGGSDDVVGVVHIKRAAAIARDKRDEVKVSSIMAAVERVPETMRLESLMGLLRSKGMQVAVVVDEYGGTAGIVTLEDLVEELIGDIRDEYDEVERDVDGGRVIEGTTNLEDVEAEIGLELPEGPYETVAGFIMAQTGELPEVGQQVAVGEYVLTVLETDNRRATRVGVERVPLTAEEAAE